MAGEEFHRIDKLVPYANKANEIKDIDAQIDETAKLDKAQSFKGIYAQCLNDAPMVQHNAEVGQVPENVQVRLAMREAETSYEAMMEIHRQIQDAYEQVKQMRQL